MLPELLPPPVLSIGLTGHRSIALSGSGAEVIAHGITTVFEALQRALSGAVAQEKPFFSAAAPTTRVVTMGAEGADFLGIRAATKLGMEVCCIVPFELDEYCRDFSPSCAAKLSATLSQAACLLELSGRRDEGARAYERANEVILSNIDVLVAIWDGSRARGRAGTGDAVQAAVVKKIPVIVIDPRLPKTAAFLATPCFDEIDLPVATDLPRKPLPIDLVEFVHSIIRPPSRLVNRQGLIDLIAETPRSGAWRSEYPLLLRIVAGRPLGKRRRAQRPPEPLNGDRSGARSDRLKTLDDARDVIDALAVRYGQSFRSSSVSQYLLVMLGVWLSGVLGLLIPSISMASMAVQLAVNGLMLADSAFRARHSWQGRWLDYRVLAERLRWLCFRYLFGLGAGDPRRADMRRNPSWIDWYLERTARALGPPRGKLDSTSIAAAADHLTAVEIPGQIDYHRQTFRQLGLLERRLSYAAHASLVASLGVAVAFGVAAVNAGGLDAVGWKPVAIALLAVLPSTKAALNGFQGEADLVRLVERSAQTIAALFRIRRAILAAPRDYDHVSFGMQRLAVIMGDELAEWRFVIESRRSRGARRLVKKNRSLLNFLRGRGGRR
jgi:hypothetical protein